MLQLLIYNGTDGFPHDLESQIRSLLWAEWPAPDDETDKPLIAPELHPVYFILAEGGLVLCYARTIWARVTHLHRNFKLYGLGDVVTTSRLRGLGYGSRIVQEAATHIRSDCEADAAVLLTEPRLEAFYRRMGWEAMPELEVRTSEYDEHNEGDCLAMMMFASASARRVRARFQASPLILPGDEW
jgi:predicted GNAT family N-acyltransferase